MGGTALSPCTPARCRHPARGHGIVPQHVGTIGSPVRGHDPAPPPWAQRCPQYMGTILSPAHGPDPAPVPPLLPEVIGVAELVNKINGPWFSKFDEDLATAFSIYCGISIAHVRARGGGGVPNLGRGARGPPPLCPRAGHGAEGRGWGDGAGGTRACGLRSMGTSGGGDGMGWDGRAHTGSRDVLGGPGWAGGCRGVLPTPSAPVPTSHPAVAAVQEGERGAVPQPPGQRDDDVPHEGEVAQGRMGTRTGDTS